MTCLFCRSSEALSVLAGTRICDACSRAFWRLSEAFVEGVEELRCQICGVEAEYVVDGRALCSTHWLPVSVVLDDCCRAMSMARTLTEISRLPEATP